MLRDAGRVAEALRAVAVLAVLDGGRFERHVEVLADGTEVRLGVAHQLLVPHRDQRNRALAQHARHRGDVAREQRIVAQRHLVVAVEERLHPRAENGERVAGEHDVLRAGVELHEEGQHERVRGRLVEEEALAGGGRQHALVHRVGVGAQRVQVVRFAARQVGDELAHRLLDVERVVGRLLHAGVVAEVRDRRDQVRLGAAVDRGVGAEHPGEQRCP